MAQTNIQPSRFRESGTFEIPLEGPMAKMHARMLKFKCGIFGNDSTLDSDDIMTSQRILEMPTEDERMDAYSEWTRLLAKKRYIKIERQLLLANLEAMQDPLTKAPNRRFLEVYLRGQVSKIDRDRQASEPKGIQMGLLFIDVDHFKSINDSLGHDMGDFALQELISILKSMTREYDEVVRWGGEEIIVYLDGVTPEIAKEKAEKIRESVQKNLKANLPRFYAEKKQKPTEEQRALIERLDGTISVGVCTYGSQDQELSSEELIRRADIAGYRSKHTGRNKVTVYDPELEKKQGKPKG